MKIGIDARMMQKGQGIGRYINRLITHLLAQDDAHQYVVFLRSEGWNELPEHPRMTKVRADIPWYSWREQLVMPYLIWRSRVDIMHFPHFNVPLLTLGKFVVTIHDLILLKHPESATVAASTRSPMLHRVKYLAYQMVLRVVVWRAARIITVSEYVKADIVRYLGVTAARIAVTYEAAELTHVQGTEAVLPTGVRRPYILYVGNAFPHKNLALLVSLAQRLQENASPLRIVLAGQVDFFTRRLCDEIAAAGMGEYICHVGRVEDEVLDLLMRSAHAYVFPSLEEGFGLPPLEAMARGTLVLSSNASCLPEILGDAAVYFDPTSLDSLWAAVCASMDSAETERMRNLREQGVARAQKFSWVRCAQETRAIYAKL